MIGELHKNKGYIYAIHGMAEVLKTNPHAVMIIIGAGVQHEMLQQKIDQLNLKSHIFLLGFIENATQYTKAFDTLLLSSIKEGLPYTLLETGLAGTPLISTTVGGTSEIIDDMRSGILIQPAKAQEIAYAITFMIEHPDIRLEYARNIAKKIKSEYGLQKMIQSVEKLYLIEAPKIRVS
jgi:glycosyltransferase involved in cell wall biosynthesis